MENGKFIWKNGKMVSWDSKGAMVHVSNHSLNYGSAVFEGIRFYETPENSEGKSAVFRLRDHVDRLFHSASVMGNDIENYSKMEIEDAIVETVRVNKFKEGYIRPLVYFKKGVGIDFGNIGGEIAIMAFPWERYKEEGVKVYITSIRRPHHLSTDISAKISGNYQNSVLAHKEARENGYDECLQLGCRAEISEGPGENIFFVKDKKLITPLEKSLLSGITRDSVLKLGKEIGLDVEETIVHPNEINGMDEAFFCGTAVEITPISEIKPIGRIVKFETQEVTNKIRELYTDTVRGKNKKHLEWLTFV